MKNTAAIKSILLIHAPKQGRALAYYDFLETVNPSQKDFLIQFSGVPRKLGRHTPDYTDQEILQLNELAPALALLSIGNLGRVLLAANLASTEDIQEVLLRGDDFEKAAVLLALNFRDDGKQLHLDVVNVCRTNSLDTYKALALNNPYPANNFTEDEFIQLTLKVLFMGLPFDQIHGLEKRCNQKLIEAVLFFYTERTAAKRIVPDICINFLKEKNAL
ncbi:EboA domain-containing protein [Lentisphaera profundi]|uniref:EboA domain-containing protein n=1 Tax=Lentisphaera profundi TaxID=1658616 RepID=A0ABY7VPG4_9BACT|nr:EboA domain-containing protein [Lentisphaera profundi]WDE96035.1 EboA domain-containing protein [Lentisphaera profundi]